MRAFGRWLLASPIQLIEAYGGILLLGAATLVWDSAGSAILMYFFGALLLFLTLHSYLKQDGSGR